MSVSDAIDRSREMAAGATVRAAEKAEEQGGEDNGELRDVREKATEIGVNGFIDDDRAQMNGGSRRAVNLVVALVVGGLMAAFLLPIAIDEIAAVDTTSWDDGAAALWDILPVMIVLAIFLFFTFMAVQRA